MAGLKSESLLSAAVTEEALEVGKRFPEFGSDFEAYAAILDSQESIAEDFKEFKKAFAQVWDCVRGERDTRIDLMVAMMQARRLLSSTAVLAARIEKMRSSVLSREASGLDPSGAEGAAGGYDAPMFGEGGGR